MTLIWMDGFDDRENMNDGWAVGDEASVSGETYTGWGTVDGQVYDALDDGYYGGIRNEVRYDVNYPGYAAAAKNDTTYENYTPYIEHNLNGTDTYFHFGYAASGVSSSPYIYFLKSGISGSDGIVVIETWYHNGLYIFRKSGDYTQYIVAASDKCRLFSNWSHYYMEGYCGIGLGNGSDFVKIWINGELVLDESGLSLSTYGIPDLIEMPGSQPSMDDCFLYSSSSPITGAPFGEPLVLAVKPSGAGSNSDFTPSTGNNYENVDEFTQDFDTTYNSSDGTSGHRDDFAVDALSDQVDSSATVKALSVHVLATGDGEQIMPYVDVGGTRYYGTAFTPPTDGTYLGTVYIWENNPSTSSPWTVSQIDSVKIGYEVV